MNEVSIMSTLATKQIHWKSRAQPQSMPVYVTKGTIDNGEVVVS